MSRITVFLISLLFSVSVFAKPHSLSWSWPVGYCPDPGQVVGDPLPSTDLLSAELIYDTQPMPMPSDTDGPCATNPDPGPPATATVVPITNMAATSITLNLQPGVTYYARIRVSAAVEGNWSSWSAQATFTVPYGRPNVITISDGGPLKRWSFVTVSSNKLNFYGG